MTTPATAIDTAALRKARGAFFTPEPLARFVTEWAVRGPQETVLEPSCGEAAFLLSAVERLHALRAAEGITGAPTVDGAELHEGSAIAAQGLLAAAGADARIAVGDFFEVEPTGTYDAVIGNPPYVRYQDFSGEARARSRAAALRAGVPISGLASSWAAFTVHASLFLKPGGRLGLVLPAELLTVNYAAEVRKFLMQRFARVELVVFEERVFPEVLEEVVLLMAEGYREGPTDHCHVFQTANAESLSRMPALPRSWRPSSPEAKWTGSLLSTSALTAYGLLSDRHHFDHLQAWGETTLGMVTGNNRYFALSPARITELGLTEDDLVRLSPPGSRHLRGLGFTESAWREMGADGAATHLFRPAGTPSAAALNYIAAGEALGVHHAYKCKVRKPWWRVPLVAPADLFLTYMNADTPRLTANRARAHHLNSVHGVYVRSGLKTLAKDLLPVAAINSMTLLSAETVGRAYGGGMLKIEPREADVLLVPSPDLIRAAESELLALRPQLATHLRNNRLLAAADLVDDVLLVRHLGMKRADVRALRDGHADMTARRVSRGGSPRGATR